MLVLDTNVVIAYFADETKLIRKIEQSLENDEEILVPTIVKAETLSYPKLDNSALVRMRTWFENVPQISLDKSIADRAAAIRRVYGLKLIDAVIAATAMALNAILISRDRDFKRVEKLLLKTW